MKNQQHQAARELYFNTNLSKTEIAEKLSVTRRTIYQWSIDGNWDKLRQSARHMPAILAEKCYYLIGHIADQLLSQDNFEPITPAQVNMLHKLTTTVKNLKHGTTVADNMETFTHFLDRIQRRDPDLAQQVAPHVTDYITDRSHKTEHDFLLDGFDQLGHLITPENALEEHHLDAEEAATIYAEQQQQQQQQQPSSTLSTTPPAATVASAKDDTPASAPRSQTPLSDVPKPFRSYEPIRPVHTPLRPIKEPALAA